MQGDRAAMHDGIPVIGRDYDDLVVGQHLFEVAYFGQPARPFRQFGQSMQFVGFGLSRDLLLQFFVDLINFLSGIN